ncbi:uncharacterized protein I206_103852 [Kwoniella pini CBS 10737]|uniref:Uncharacterized protein n=1 Tax=Kwoniella pini CBS 10737 TaxID=1296096 RepID=A0A1B9HSR6_9TREE|nr:uncharacterized protein I206_07805 [Kwoniella pini CBS 10737]OCF46323.1 hypothetical protein I206_07805 [Kwoniella pini CBS 10737]
MSKVLYETLTIPKDSNSECTYQSSSFFRCQPLYHGEATGGISALIQTSMWSEKEKNQEFTKWHRVAFQSYTNDSKSLKKPEHYSALSQTSTKIMYTIADIMEGHEEELRQLGKKRRRGFDERTVTILDDHQKECFDKAVLESPLGEILGFSLEDILLLQSQTRDQTSKIFGVKFTSDLHNWPPEGSEQKKDTHLINVSTKGEVERLLKYKSDTFEAIKSRWLGYDPKKIFPDADPSSVVGSSTD